MAARAPNLESDRDTAPVLIPCIRRGEVAPAPSGPSPGAAAGDARDSSSAGACGDEPDRPTRRILIKPPREAFPAPERAAPAVAPAPASLAVPADPFAAHAWSAPPDARPSDAPRVRQRVGFALGVFVGAVAVVLAEIAVHRGAFAGGARTASGSPPLVVVPAAATGGGPPAGVVAHEGAPNEASDHGPPARTSAPPAARPRVRPRPRHAPAYAPEGNIDQNVPF